MVWALRKISNILKLEYGKPLPKEDRDNEGDYPAYGANGVKNRTNRYLCDERGIVVGRKGSAGEVNLTEEKYWPLDVTYYVTFDRTQYDLMFLFYCLQSLNLTSLAKGVKPGINRNDVYALEISVPPLSEQQRIVSILDEAFAGIDAAIENTKRNLANARELFESYLSNIFSPKGDVLKDIPAVSIEKVCESIVDCLNRTAPTVDEITPFKMIRTTNVRNRRVSLDNVKHVTEETYQKWTRRQTPRQGDVLLTREAPMGEVGMIETDEPVFLGQRIVSYRADPAQLDNYFLFFALQSSDLQNQIKAYASGSTVQHMRVPDTKELILRLPPIDTQKKIVADLNKVLLSSELLETRYQQKLDRLTELKQSIMQKAFSGELTGEKVAA